MHAKDIALRQTAQGETSFYNLEVRADDLDPRDCAVEVVHINSNLKWRLGLLDHSRVCVCKVVPCPYCQRPIAVLRLVTESTLRVCDAVQDPECPERWIGGKTPEGYQEPWSANVFRMHECPTEGAAQ